MDKESSLLCLCSAGCAQQGLKKNAAKRNGFRRDCEMAVLSVPRQKEDLAEGCACIKKACLLDLSPFLTQARSRAVLLRRKTETTQGAPKSSSSVYSYMPHWSSFFFLVHPAPIFSVPFSYEARLGFYISLNECSMFISE